MKKWIKVILAVLIVVVFFRAMLVMTGYTGETTGIQAPSIAVMEINGQIFDSKQAIDTLKKYKENPLVEGVVIKVDSPGGAVTPSMEIYDYILTLGKPVYAAMGSVAASGGYLISLGADSIYAEPSTITGSIGVIMNLVNTQELMDKIGIKSVVLKSGEFKDSGSPARQMTEKDKEVLNQVLMDMYYQFTDIVIQRRGLSKEKVMALADGRIYTGKMAQSNGLVNNLGSWEKAVKDMKAKLNKEDLETYIEPKEKTILEKLTEATSNTELNKMITTKTGFFLFSGNILMFAKVNSSYLHGIKGIRVDVECDSASYGLPSFSIVGLGDNAIKESKDRVKAALKNLDYHFFNHPLTINLAPADMKKEGSHFDLPISLAILLAAGVIEKNLDDYLFLGELSLDGRLRSVTGVLSMVEYSVKAGIKKIILPYDNVCEASLIPEAEVYGFNELSEVIAFLRGDKEYKSYENKLELFNESYIEYDADFKDVRGQFQARRAAEISASGMHNFIMIGSPGSGKTMIAKRMPSILAPMTLQEALETTKIHSVAGLIKDGGTLINKRPFVSPHHTSSNIAIIGGGTKALPGNVSIASGGILFLDEMLEFSRSVLEVLRQPMEDRTVTIARAGRTITYPAKFMLVGAMNPCPCGYLGDSRKDCTCTPNMIDRYRAKLSGPMLDRIDLIARVEAVDYKDLMDYKEGESSKDIRERVINTHKIQAERFKDENILYNSEMTESLIRKYCILDQDAKRTLENIMSKYNISARSYSKILKTSRTIADMSESENITKSHILEAFQMKLPDNEI